MEKRRPRVEDVVVFHDTEGVPHNALVKCVFDRQKVVKDAEGNPKKDGEGYTVMEDFAPDDMTDLPLINVVHVSGDKARQDSCGRQTEVPSSVPHADPVNGVHGYYWRFPWEEPVPYRAPSDV